MSFLRTDAEIEVLLVTKGHPFVRDPFFAMFESFADVNATHVEQPAAQHFFTPENAAGFDAIVLYDMPGIEFRPGGPRFHDPPTEYVEGFLALLDSGCGIVFLHHALAGWPTWPEYAEIAGGRFLYRAADLRGETLPDSGYRHAVKHRVSPVDPNHPVVAGLGEGYEIEDELYLFRVFEEDVTPLLRSDARFEDDFFYSSARAVAGDFGSREGWSHPKGSNLAAWTHRVRNSSVVAITGGDGPGAYANPGLRRLLHNAIRWVAGEARHSQENSTLPER